MGIHTLLKILWQCLWTKWVLLILVDMRSVFKTDVCETPQWKEPYTIKKEKKHFDTELRISLEDPIWGRGLRVRGVRQKNRTSVRSWTKRCFAKTCRPANGRTPSLIQRVVRILSLGIKRPRRKSDHSLPSNANDTDGWGCTSISHRPSLHPHGNFYIATYSLGHAVAQLVEAQRYNSEGRGFDSRWLHWNFSLT